MGGHSLYRYSLLVGYPVKFLPARGYVPVAYCSTYEFQIKLKKQLMNNCSLDLQDEECDLFSIQY